MSCINYMNYRKNAILKVKIMFKIEFKIFITFYAQNVTLNCSNHFY